MRSATRILPLAVTAAVLLGLPNAAAHAHPPTAHMSDAQMIASAMRAAPSHVSQHATIMAMDAKGGMRTLRKGSNGFTCIPDAPATPGPDPMCADAHAMGWLKAYMGHTTPPHGMLGFVYMLEGGTDASNTDPYATGPKNNHWIETGPHVMVLGADDSFYANYPKSADPDTGAPYVMWAGTPYQHLMVPIH